MSSSRASRVGARGGRGGNDGGPSSSSPEDRLKLNVSEAMKKYAVGEFNVPMASIAAAENSRQVNPAGVRQLMDSIRSKGFMATSPPQIMFPEIGEDEHLTQDQVDNNKLRAICIDGSHRIEALKLLAWAEPIRCVCYRNISDVALRGVLSDECNTTTSTFVERSTYDQLFYYSTLMLRVKAVKAKTQGNRRGNSSSAVKVTAVDLCACWDEVGGNPPQRGAVNAWMNVVNNTSTAALETLRTMSVNGVEAKDDNYKRISKSWLGIKGVADLRSKPEQQALVMEIYLRLPREKRINVKQDTEGVLDQAEETMKWIETVRFIVPREEWSTKLETMVKEYSYAKPGHYANYIRPHLQRVAASVEKIEGQLPHHSRELDPTDKDVLLAEPTDAMRNIINKDPKMRPKLVEFDRKHQSVMDKANQLKLQHNRPTESSRRSSNSIEGDGSNPAGTPGTPSSPAKDCGLGASATVPNPGAGKRDAPSGSDHGGSPSTPSGKGREPDPTGSNATKRRRGPGRATTNDNIPTPRLPSSPEKDGKSFMLACRDQWTYVHDLTPLRDDFRLDDLPSLKTKRKVMLLFIAPGAIDPKGMDMKTWRERLLKISYTACDQLDPKGTVVALVPQPYYDHATAIADSLRQVEMKLTLEQHGLVVEYGNRGGGLVSPKKALHLSTGVDHFLVAHRQGDDFTCNESVLPQKFPGMLRTSEGRPEPNTAAASVMTAVPYLGAKRRFSDNVAAWAIQRFTSYGDTVATLTADEDGVVEAALSYGRRAEAFLVGGDEAGGTVRKGLDDAFLESWRLQHIRHESEAEELHRVKTGTLPMGLPEETTPAAVSGMIDQAVDVQKDDDALDEDAVRLGIDGRRAALFTVAKKLADDQTWCLRDAKEEEDAPIALCAKSGQDYGEHTSSAIPLWGELVIYDTPKEAYDSLPEHYFDPPTYVRLVLVADSALLRTMCENGKEVLSSDTVGLYLRVAPSCPAFYALWEDEIESPTHEVRNDLDRQATRDALLKQFKHKAPVCLTVAKAISKSKTGKGAVVKVKAGVSIACARWTDDASESSDAGVHAEDEDDSDGME